VSKSVLQASIFVFAIFLALEFSLRVMFFGTDALSPAKMNSHVVILDSEFVQPASSTDIYYELKPNVNGLFRGKAFTTNSAGMPDKEYALKKPPGTYRIAVIGSSWTMGTGVAPEHAYQAVLEDKLQAWPTGKHTEVLNFGVEMYGLGEMTATVRHKALAYDPDMIIFAITTITPKFLWADHQNAFLQTPTIPPFLRSYVLSAVMEAMGRPLYKNSVRSQIKNPYGDYMRQIELAMGTLGELTAEKQIPVTVLWLSLDQINESMLTNSARHANNQGFSFIPINLTTKAAEYDFEDNLLTGRIDRHPNMVAHQVIAETILQEALVKEND
jgi:hypothetical protein